VLAEFGDDPRRYADGKARRNYAGTSPVTRASGKRKVVGVVRRAGTRYSAHGATWRAFVPRSKPAAARTETDIHLGQGVLNPC
jgi:transposase